MDRETRTQAQQSEQGHSQHGSFTVTEWCAFRKVSRAMLYKLLAAGKGPRTHNVGVKRLISSEADEAWVRSLETETVSRANVAA